MIVVFFAVGFLEIFSILFRPVSLSFRLYGNIFAGENMLEAMSHLIKDPPWARAIASFLVPVPFYLMELLVGVIQALVFMLLNGCLHDADLSARRRGTWPRARRDRALSLKNNFNGLTVFNRGSR